MKKSVCKPIAVLLCGALLAAGCSGGAGGDDGQAGGGIGFSQAGGLMGRYVQQDVTPLGLTGVGNTLVALADGTVALAAPKSEGGVMAYTTADGAEWHEMDTAAVSAFAAEHFTLELTTAVLGADGAWWAANFSPEGENRLYHIPAGGAGRELSVPALEAPGDGGWMTHYVGGLYPGADGSVLVEFISGGKKQFITVDAAGKAVSAFSPPGFPACTGYMDGKVYCVGTGGKTQEVYSAADGGKLDSRTLPLEAGFFDNLRCVTMAADGSLCFASPSGIQMVAPGGGILQTVADNRSYAFASANFRPSSMLAADDGSFWIACDEGGAGRVYRYVFDETVPASAAHSLTVWAMEDNALLREAVSTFARENPDYDVLMEFGRAPGDDGRTDEDIIRALNTRLLANDSPDVLILDGLPAQAMIRQGILLDLSGTVDKADYYGNILSAYSADGADYAYPAAFLLPCLVKREGSPGPGIGGSAALAELQDILADPANAYFGGYRHLFDTLYAAGAPAIFPGGVAVDEAALRDFFEVSGAIVAGQGITDSETDPITGSYTVMVDTGSGAEAQFEKRPSLVMYGGDGAGNRWDYAADVLTRFTDYLSLDLLNSRPQLEPLPGGVFIPVCAAGVPVGAPDAEGGKRFVRALLEGQTEAVARYRLPGFLVKRGVELASAVARYEQLLAEPDELGGEPANPALVDWDGLIAKYTVANSTEPVLKTRVYEQARQLYAGLTSLEDAVAEVLRGTEIYFAERR